MKIVIEEPQGVEEDQIIFKCREMTPKLLHVIALLKTQDGLVAYDGNEIHRILPTAIYYIEVVLDNGEKLIISRQYVSDLKKRLGV